MLHLLNIRLASLNLSASEKFIGVTLKGMIQFYPGILFEGLFRSQPRVLDLALGIIRVLTLLIPIPTPTLHSFFQY
jgi:hypothetical protein